MRTSSVVAREYLQGVDRSVRVVGLGDEAGVAGHACPVPCRQV
ncbi:hypothetical protein [Streptomyces sp. NBC_00057]